MEANNQTPALDPKFWGGRWDAGASRRQSGWQHQHDLVGIRRAGERQAGGWMDGWMDDFITVTPHRLSFRRSSRLDSIFGSFRTRAATLFSLWEAQKTPNLPQGTNVGHTHAQRAGTKTVVSCAHWAMLHEDHLGTKPRASRLVHVEDSYAPRNSLLTSVRKIKSMSLASLGGTTHDPTPRAAHAVHCTRLGLSKHSITACQALHASAILTMPCKSRPVD
ncbi:hypothetical protein MAPG_02915 [Magnaporthiopsis poae ATCC 64411]|uniref:Uncharacterized protein n=1 Tax=Magnaporthiopsis poae (strain ATCC 64411 / 73-15) TaxID=644358 RepID=A0A0C4DSN3_MAGP6|nr:hypothetical protein MAPG_02915 [Magnaporthiopsis poae ATCC 64411]